MGARRYLSSPGASGGSLQHSHIDEAFAASRRCALGSSHGGAACGEISNGFIDSASASRMPALLHKHVSARSLLFAEQRGRDLVAMAAAQQCAKQQQQDAQAGAASATNVLGGAASSGRMLMVAGFAVGGAGGTRADFLPDPDCNSTNTSNERSAVSGLELFMGTAASCAEAVIHAGAASVAPSSSVRLLPDWSASRSRIWDLAEEGLRRADTAAAVAAAASSFAADATATAGLTYVMSGCSSAFCPTSASAAAALPAGYMHILDGCSSGAAASPRHLRRRRSVTTGSSSSTAATSGISCMEDSGAASAGAAAEPSLVDDESAAHPGAYAGAAATNWLLASAPDGDHYMADAATGGAASSCNVDMPAASTDSALFPQLKLLPPGMAAAASATMRRMKATLLDATGCGQEGVMRCTCGACCNTGGGSSGSSGLLLSGVASTTASLLAAHPHTRDVGETLNTALNLQSQMTRLACAARARQQQQAQQQHDEPTPSRPAGSSVLRAAAGAVMGSDRFSDSSAITGGADPQQHQCHRHIMHHGRSRSSHWSSDQRQDQHQPQHQQPMAEAIAVTSTGERVATAIPLEQTSQPQQHTQPPPFGLVSGCFARGRTPQHPHHPHHRRQGCHSGSIVSQARV
ncbi:hypothetical protein HYH02_015045 [Chlamydomonas schloesseri]|uniref:Uncharacterized protein n=1 Tax=Chlamydomonas schloesseri TaxID=2026947 RepID=A0A835VTF5_9CHLO|nr:hypothetical protein HYH02_015045 [Chlamydomonas schloesseri]|eukprot:KAG2425218.1 hypothetical protein HYH02_015045 [Chlamydomonas schloesseri]